MRLFSAILNYCGSRYFKTRFDELVLLDFTCGWQSIKSSDESTLGIGITKVDLHQPSSLT